MGEPIFLRDLVVLLTASLPIVYLCQRLRLPALVGFLLTGVFIGPSATGLIRDTHTVELLAEVGVILLLFTIGLEVSVTRLVRMSRTVLGCGGLQVAASCTAAAAGALLTGFTLPQAITFGFLVALSSTAIVLTLLSDQAELETPHGRIALGVLVFQDLCIVPMMLLLPLLGQPDAIGWAQIGATLAAALAAVAGVVLSTRIVFPALLRQVVRLRNRELFIGTVVLFCFGAAWLTAQLGLSLAIGAFVAGLVISESEYSHQVVTEVLPLRDLFNSVFFMSMGMLFDIPFFSAHAFSIVLLALLILTLKSVLAALTVLPFYRSSRVAVTVGLLLAQIGEFSFVLAHQALRLDIIATMHFQFFLAASVLTMLATPFLVASAPWLTRRWLPSRDEAPAPAADTGVAGHVVIIGYGLNGRNLARVLRATGLVYRILELNSATVSQASRQGEPIHFGDATRAAVLDRVAVRTAAVVVVAISDPAATRRIAFSVRQLSPATSLIVRTRYMSEIEELYRLGANEVIPEEFETSVEIFARVLRRMHVPRNVIQMQVDIIRGERYAMLRGLQLPGEPLEDLHLILQASTTETYLIRDRSPAVGQTLRELGMRSRTGVTIIAVVRNTRPFTNPAPDLRMETGDVLVMLGDHPQLAAAARLLDPPESPPV